VGPHFEDIHGHAALVAGLDRFQKSRGMNRAEHGKRFRAQQPDTSGRSLRDHFNFEYARHQSPPRKMIHEHKVRARKDFYSDSVFSRIALFQFVNQKPSHDVDLYECLFALDRVVATMLPK
jgi:hypothetical protein